MEPDFDSMSLQELFGFKETYMISIPQFGDLVTADALRVKNDKSLVVEELPRVRVGKSSYTVYTKEFEKHFRDLLKDAYLTPKSRQGFEILRQDIIAMSFQELVDFNRYRNLVGDQSLKPLYDNEIKRRQDGTPMTQTIRNGGIELGFSDQFVDDLRQAVIAAVDQKEKDFINERSS